MSARSDEPGPARGGPPWLRGLEALALLALLMVVAMRPLVSETYNSGIDPISRAAGQTGSTTPALTAAFDLVIILAALAVAWSRTVQRKRWRWTGLEIGWLIMLGAAVVSTSLTGNKRLAASASADWLITALLVFVLPNLCRDRLRIGLVLAVIVASGLTSATRSAMQAGFEFRDTREMYFENKADFWGKQNVPLDDPRVELYERRLRGAAATGFFPHSNVEAALLSLCAFAAFALAGLLWESMPARIAGIAGGAGLFAATILCASKGGTGAAAIGLLLLGAAWRWRSIIARRVFAVWLLVCAVLTGGLLGIFALGQIRGRLPGSSLQFRWEYWQVTGRIIRDHLWAGVGAMNFDRAYLLYKPIQYPEEIRDPHNFLLSLLAQWGLPGLLGLLCMLAVGLWRGLSGDRVATPNPTTPLPSVERRALLAWGVALIVAYLITRTILLSDYWGSDDPGASALFVFDLELYGVVWALVVAGVLRLLSRAPDGDPASSRMTLALLCGMLAFLLHNLIEFSIFYPGTLTTFCAMAGLACAGKTDQKIDDRELHPAANARSAILVNSALLITLLGFGAFVFWPTTQANRLLAQARQQITPSQTERAFAAAAEVDPWDPTAPAELAAFYTQFKRSENAIEWMQRAVQRDPTDLDLHHLLSLMYGMHYAAERDPADVKRGVAAARRALALYPASPDKLVNFAEVLSGFAAATHDDRLAREAREAFQMALQLDAARPGTDEVRRWSPRRRADIEQRMRDLRSVTAQSAPATQSIPSS